MSERIEIHTQQEYFDQLIGEVTSTRSGDRIAISTMAFEPHHHPVDRLLPELTAAATRNVDVLLAIDAYAFMFDGNFLPSGPLAPWPVGNKKSTQAHFQKKSAIFDQLNKSGVKVKQINTPPKIHLPYAGRSHIKSAVVNDNWWVGGCNLADTDNLDVMVGNRDGETADFLYDTLHKIADKGSVQAALGKKDIAHPINDTTDLLIDVGLPNQSLIYDRALETIATAKHWVTMTCQFFPSGKTARYLAQAAKRNVDVLALYNSPAEKRLGGNIMGLYRKKEQLLLPPQLFQGEIAPDLPFMHAKIVASEKMANVGSHNYIQAGVLLGTAEIAIQSNDPELANQAREIALRIAGKTPIETA